MGSDNINEADFYIALGGGSRNLHEGKTVFIKREPKFINNSKLNYQNIVTCYDSSCGITWLV